MADDTIKNRIQQNNTKLINITDIAEDLPADLSLNIFTQLEEPEKKKGIWLQTNKTAEHYISDNNIAVGGWSAVTQMPYNFISGATAIVGTDVYLFGGNSSSQMVYKYDTLTATYTRMSDMPYAVGAFDAVKAVSIGSDVYLFGGGDGNQNAYMYNTSTDTYTKLTDIPEYFRSVNGGVVGTNIYLLGTGTNYQGAYKYDILTDTYTQLTNMPEAIDTAGDAVVGTNIYLFSEGWSSIHYKYDTLTDTYIQIAAVPEDYIYGSATTVGTDVYLLGSSNKNGVINYKYDTLTDTYTKMADIPYTDNFYYGSAETVGTNIYLFGGQKTGTNSCKYDTVISTYDTDNTVVIEQGNTYSTALINTDFEEGYQPIYTFDDVYFYTLQDGLDGTMPIYYGDGTQWINIKNPPT